MSVNKLLIWAPTGNIFEWETSNGSHGWVPISNTMILEFLLRLQAGLASQGISHSAGLDFVVLSYDDNGGILCRKVGDSLGTIRIEWELEWRLSMLDSNSKARNDLPITRQRAGAFWASATTHSPVPPVDGSTILNQSIFDQQLDSSAFRVSMARLFLTISLEPDHIMTFKTTLAGSVEPCLPFPDLRDGFERNEKLVLRIYLYHVRRRIWEL